MKFSRNICKLYAKPLQLIFNNLFYPKVWIFKSGCCIFAYQFTQSPGTPPDKELRGEKKMNSKVTAFLAKTNEVVARKKDAIDKEVAKHIAAFKAIELVSFSNENQYNGVLTNKIFFTYSNHYRGNSGTWMQVGCLRHPHTGYEDRGYIKGVATDLQGYMVLRAASELNHHAEPSLNVGHPWFRKSKHSEAYRAQCQAIIDAAIAELNLFVAEKIKEMNAELKALTGCSLLHYIQSI